MHACKTIKAEEVRPLYLTSAEIGQYYHTSSSILYE